MESPEETYARKLGRWLLYALAAVLLSLLAALVQKWTGVAIPVPSLPVPLAEPTVGP